MIVIKGRGIIHMAYRRHALAIIIRLAATSDSDRDRPCRVGVGIEGRAGSASWNTMDTASMWEGMMSDISRGYRLPACAKDCCPKYLENTGGLLAQKNVV